MLAQWLRVRCAGNIFIRIFTVNFHSTSNNRSIVYQTGISIGYSTCCNDDETHEVHTLYLGATTLTGDLSIICVLMISSSLCSTP